jgi:hypothetical protein
MPKLDRLLKRFSAASELWWPLEDRRKRLKGKTLKPRKKEL